MPTEPKPLPIVLGIAERAAQVRDRNTNLYMWNTLGLRTIVPCAVFPMPFPNWSLAVAFPADAFTEDQRFVFLDSDDTELGWLAVEGAAQSTASLEAGPEAEADKRHLSFLAIAGSWTLLFIPIVDTKILLRRPGPVVIRLKSAAGPTVGRLNFALLSVPPLTVEQINAIRSNPVAAKAVQIKYQCNTCHDTFKAYSALERLENLELQGFQWHKDIPARYACTCGANTIELEYIRNNLHALLGSPITSRAEVSFVPLYEGSALAELRAKCTQLFSSARKEEELQMLLEQNPILLHQFAGLRIFHKPPILTKFVADFAVLTPQRHLVLIEIEKSTTRLLKKDGGVAAELSHAFDQVRSWLHVADEHRLALLDAMGIERSEVGAVRGVVIAGRDQGYDALHLRRLKGSDWGSISLLTYDDLLFALESLIGKVDRL